MEASWRGIAIAAAISALLITASCVGLRYIETVYAASAGPTLVGTGFEEQGDGTQDWAFEARLTSDDGSYVVTNQGLASEWSWWLRGDNLGFSIPTDATIDGLEVSFKRYETHCGGCSTNPDGTEIQVVKANSRTGTVDSFNDAVPTGSGAAATLTRGGPTDLWGTTWTAADINDSDFGFAVRYHGGSNYFGSVFIDAMRVTVYYTEAGAGAQVVHSDETVMWIR